MYCPPDKKVKPEKKNGGFMNNEWINLLILGDIIL